MAKKLTRAQHEFEAMGGERRHAQRREEQRPQISYVAERRKQQRRRAIKLQVLAYNIEKWRDAFIAAGGKPHA